MTLHWCNTWYVLWKCYRYLVLLAEGNSQEVAKELNQYFGHITDSLGLYEFPDVRVCEGLNDIDNIVYKFINHPSIVKIK